MPVARLGQVLVVTALLLASGCAHPDQTVIHIAGRPRFASVLTGSGLGPALAADRARLTVFAPSDAAMRAAAAAHPSAFAGQDAQAFLAKLHMVTRHLSPTELAAAATGSIRVAAGLSLPLSSAGGVVRLDGAKVGRVISDDGRVIIYALDRVIIPPGQR